jgi:signal transduction histidine kinase
MISNWLRKRPVLGDLALVGLLLFVTVGAATRHEHAAVGIVLGTIETLLLLARRRRPALVVVCVAGVALAMSVLDIWVVPLQLGVALYALATLQPSRAQRALAYAAIGSMAITLLIGAGLELGGAAARVVFLVAAWLLGDSVGSRRAYVREIEEKAERLERERQSEARRAAAEEQARIARELHDVVAHALSVIVVQAGAADDVFEVDPRRAREPIRAIDVAARAALADLRRVLGTLTNDAEYGPQPGIGRLDELIGQLRGTGLDVALEIEGRPRQLPAAVDLSAYRIVQEALTNVLKHADAGHAHVRVRYGDPLVVEVSDDGNGSANGGGSGNGLIGMRERSALLGGTIETGPSSSGGYRVRASLPIGEARP